MEKVVLKILHLLSLFSPRLKLQLQGRELSDAKLVEIARDRSNHENGAVIYCSSAGEFEQARPLIGKLNENDWYVHVFFFSKSGVDFCIKRNETIPFSLAPIDSLFTWGRIFSALRPNKTIVVRHEFWPAFIEAASRWGKTSVIDFTVTKTGFISRFLKNFLLKEFTTVFCVQKSDKEYLSRVGIKKILQVGDTKFDRAVERRKIALNHVNIQNFAHRFAGQKVIVAGSIYREDLDFLSNQLKHFRGISILVPHDISDASIQNLSERLNSHGIVHRTIKDLEEIHEVGVYLVQKLGVLAELYGVATFAYVGGGIHHKVHNVLEPLIWGLPVAFGPRYKNSAEAIAAIDAKASKVLTNDRDVQDWLAQSHSEAREQVLMFVNQHVGATELILKELQNQY